MSLRKIVRDLIENVWVLRELKYAFNGPLAKIRYLLIGSDHEKFLVTSGHKYILACADNDLIPRVPDAGKIRGGRLIMHNGVKILPASYLGYQNLRMLMNSKGVHEPQEERVFGEVLKRIPSGGVMIELGAYWAFYSLWFAQEVADAHCFLVEPTLSNLNYGRKNFGINHRQGVFTRAYVGQQSGMVDGVPQICIDDFVKKQGIAHIDILHADIQGFELQMLHGAQRTIDAGRIDYFFISTHSNELHRDCEAFLKENHYVIIASANRDDSYLPDGVLVGRREAIEGLGPVPIALRSHTTDIGQPPPP